MLFEESQGIQVHGCPPWMPDRLWDAVCRQGKTVVNVIFTKSERKRLRKRKQILPSIWAERHRVLIKSRLPGAWRNHVTPYSVGIMDAGSRPYVREIITCKVPQSGISEAINNFIGAMVDMAPGDWLCTYPDESTAKTNLKDRVIPMFLNSVRLRSYLTGKEKDLSAERINLQHMTIYPAWAGSVSSMANKPIRYANSDEIDKPSFGDSRKEASPLDLIDKRLNTFRDISKHFKTSTPSVDTGNIWQQLNHNTDVIFDFYVRCPFCSKMQLMSMEGLKWEGGSKADHREIEKKHLAWYECESCGEKWNDDHRNTAARAGDWLDRETRISIKVYLDKFRPANVGFYLPAFPIYFISLSHIASAFIQGVNDKTRKKLKDFRNSFEALPWEEFEVLVDRKVEDVLRCKCDLPVQTVPTQAVCLTAGIDRQKVGFPYVVRAWANDFTSWLVDYGELRDWADVERLLYDTGYPIEGSDEVMRICRAAIDTGGGKYNSDISSTEDTYLWLQDHMGWGSGCQVWGSKGSSNPLPSKLKVGSVLNKTPSGKALKMGMKLYFLDTDKFKDLFSERMGRALDKEPGGAWLHAETGLDYAKQIISERKQLDDRGIETWVQVGRDNHWLDCECMAAAVADWEWPGGGVNLMDTPVNVVRRAKPKQQKTRGENPFTGGHSLFG